MTTRVRDITSAALGLPAEQRAQLARQLMESLDQDPEIEAAWDEEIRQRVEAWQAGVVKEVPWEQVREEARRRVEER